MSGTNSAFSYIRNNILTHLTPVKLLLQSRTVPNWPAKESSWAKTIFFSFLLFWEYSLPTNFLLMICQFGYLKGFFCTFWSTKDLLAILCLSTTSITITNRDKMPGTMCSLPLRWIILKWYYSSLKDQRARQSEGSLRLYLHFRL